MKVLFICKKRRLYSDSYASLVNSGLYNSTNFIVRAMRMKGITARLVDVTDGNDVDREVASFRPHVVVLEALWVAPSKIDELLPRHPGVRWFVHLHSQIPFLSMEGSAMRWLLDYKDRGVVVISNSQQLSEIFSICISDLKPVYLPNVYLADLRDPVVRSRHSENIDIGCFGAVRPLKNQLIQAMAAIMFARRMGQRLRFHMNTGRFEGGGEPVLRNIQALFEKISDAELVLHQWLDHDDFLDLLHDQIDISMQVSLSETFNVVTADAVSSGLPVVVSSEINWVSRKCWPDDPTGLDSIMLKLAQVHRNASLVRTNQAALTRYSEVAIQRWAKFLLSRGS